MVAADGLRHPPPDVLREFALGRLMPLEMAEAERHIENCDSCCAALAQIPDDTLLDRIRPGQTSHAVTHVVPGGFTLGESAASQGELSASLSSNPPRDVAAKAGGGSYIPRELHDHPRYRIIKTLGVGGMGVVFEAEHRLMERTVALKVINSRLVRHPLAVERFRQEVRAAARLSHPNIVTAFDAEQAGDLHFLVMEFVEGESLDRLVGRRGPLPIVHACNYVRQAALGLQHAANLGMVHRDVKPHNLMLAKGGRVKILDFGLARLARELDAQLQTDLDADLNANSASGSRSSARPPLASTLTADGAVLGTPDYMAPEQAGDARRADIRADIYSLGCTLYFLLTGQPPFAEGTIVEKLVAHQTRLPRDVRELRPDVPSEVAQILARMLEKSPAVRWQTPEEIVKCLLPFSSATAFATTSSAAAGRPSDSTPTGASGTTPDHTRPDNATLSTRKSVETLRTAPGSAPLGEPLELIELEPVGLANPSPTQPDSPFETQLGASDRIEDLSSWHTHPAASWPGEEPQPDGPLDQLVRLWRTQRRWLGPALVTIAGVVALGLGGWWFWGFLAGALHPDRGDDYAARGTSNPGVQDAGAGRSDSPSRTATAAQSGAKTGRWLIVLPRKNFWYQDYARLVEAIQATGGGEIEIASSSLEPPTPAPDDRFPSTNRSTIRPDVLLRDADAARYDVVVFSGCVPTDANEFLSDRPNGGAVKQLLKGMVLDGKPVAGLCSGIAVLADAGVLRGEPAAKNEFLPQRILVGSGAQWDGGAAVQVTSRGIWTARDESAAQELVVRLRRSLAGKL